MLVKSSSFTGSRQEIIRTSQRHRTTLDDPAPNRPSVNPFQSVNTLSSSICLSNNVPPTPNPERNLRDSFKNVTSHFGTKKNALELPPTQNLAETFANIAPSSEATGLKKFHMAANGVMTMKKLSPFAAEAKDRARMTPMRNSQVPGGDNAVDVSEKQRALGGSRIMNTEKGGAGTVPAKPRYSYVRQKVLYMPKDIESITMTNGFKPSFNSFDELARKTQTVNAEMFDNLVSQNLDLLKPPEGGSTKNQTQLNLIQKMLKFNQIQKDHYVEHMHQKEQRATSMGKIHEGLKTPARRATPVRIVPSKKIFTNLYEFTDNDEIETMETMNDKSHHNHHHMARSITPAELRTDETLLANKSMMANQIIMKNRVIEHIRFFWHFGHQDRGQWKPAAREGHTMTTIGRALVVYGGISSKVTSDIAIYEVGRDLWITPEVKGDVPLTGRHSHTACESQGKIVIFGGEKDFNPQLNIRECLNDIYTFELDKKEWKVIKSAGSNTISARRNHAAAIHDKFMYVSGGLDGDGLFLNDFWCFNMKTHEWIHLDIPGDREGGQAFHTMAACFEEKAVSFQQHHHHHSSHHNPPKPKSFEEGLYVFGGKDSEGKVLGKLKFLSLAHEHSEKLEWKYPAVQGVAPYPRYNHVMIFHQHLKLLLIHGGRNDNINHLLNNTSLDDIRILDLEKMSWGTSYCTGNVPKIGRARHAASLIGSTLAIFGGVGYTEYATPDVKLIETNQLTAWKLAKDYDMKYKMEQEALGQTPNKSTPQPATPMPEEQGSLIEKQVSFKPELIWRKESIRLEPITGSPANRTSNVRGSIRETVKENGFNQTVKNLHQVEAERMRLRKIFP